MLSKNFFESLESLASERSLSIDSILKKVETAMGVACRDTGYTGDIKIEIDAEKKKIRFIEYLYVVEEVTEGNRGEITVEEARELRPKTKVKPGTVLKKEVEFAKFGRKAVSKFKNTLNNELKGLEREEAYEFFSEKVGEIITVTVVAANDRFITFSLGKGTFASMPVSEAIPGEEYIAGTQKKVYVSKVEKTTKGPKVYITRSNREIVKKLFELMIPEIADGSVEIVGISREAGNRTKIGVTATKPNLDAKGACVGQGGLRIRAINEFLNNEKIDIFTWRENTADLIAESLLPARCLSVVINDEKEKHALVIVKDDQYSLAIGRNGQNVRLAAYATDWRIDIKKFSDAVGEGIRFVNNVTINK